MKKLSLRIAPNATVLFAFVLALAVVPATWANTAPNTAPKPAPETLPAAAEPAAVPLAMVNGEPVYPEDAERQLAETHQQVTEGMRADFDLDQLVFRLVNDTLLAQEARAMEMQDEEPIPGKLEALRRELAVKHLEVDEVWRPATASDEEIRQAFEREYQRVTLRVLTTLEKDEAEAALAELRGTEDSEGADFATLVKERLVDPYKLRGGLVEDLARIDLQTEIAEAAFAAEPGALVGPVRTSIGWSLVRVESFAAADPERFDAVRRDLRDLIRYRKGQALKAALAAKLREQHPVTVNAETLAAIVPERQTDARLVPKVADRAAVVAHVGDETVTAGELGDALMWRWKGVRNEEAARAAMPLVLDGLLESKLLLDEALARGYDHTPAVERSVAALEKDLLVERYLKTVLGPQVDVTPEEMKAYYQEHLASFNRPPRVHVSQITVATPEEAQAIVRQVREGTDFAWLARRDSIDRFKEVGGERGWLDLTPGADAFNDSLLAAKPGDVLDPMGVPGNWTVVRVNLREEQGPYPYDQVSGNVRTAVYQEKFQRFLGEFLDKLRSRSEISVNEDALAELRITGTHEDAAPASGGHGHGAH